MDRYPTFTEPNYIEPWYKRVLLVFSRIVVAIIVIFAIVFVFKVYQITEDYRTGNIDSFADDAGGFTQFSGAIDTSTPLSREELETKSDPWFGNPDAKVVVVEFGDFECPFTRQAFVTVRKLAQEFKDDVLFIWRDFPLYDIHPYAIKAAEAGECANEQGKFWEYHDKLFINQRALFTPDLKRYAAEVGLNTRQFNLCLDTGKYAKEVMDDFETAVKAGAAGTPTFFINGEKVSGLLPEAIFREVLKDLVESAKQEEQNTEAK